MAQRRNEVNLLGKINGKSLAELLGIEVFTVPAVQTEEEKLRIQRAEKLIGASLELLIDRAEKNKGYINKEGSYMADISSEKKPLVITYSNDPQKPNKSFIGTYVYQKSIFRHVLKGVAALSYFKNEDFYLYSYTPDKCEDALEKEYRKLTPKGNTIKTSIKYLDEVLKNEMYNRLKKARNLYDNLVPLVISKGLKKEGPDQHYTDYLLGVRTKEGLFIVMYHDHITYSHLTVDLSRGGVRGYFNPDMVLSASKDERSKRIKLDVYEPGNWEKLLENEADGYVKSPVSPEARKQIARQKPTVQKIVDDEEASRQ